MFAFSWVVIIELTGDSGAGIAGLSLFQALSFMDKENKLDIKIYESSKLRSDIGAGIRFSPRAIQILKAIGLGDRIATILPDDDPDSLSEC